MNYAKIKHVFVNILSLEHELWKNDFFSGKNDFFSGKKLERNPHITRDPLSSYIQT
jgi:hypothetical protein